MGRQAGLALVVVFLLTLLAVGATTTLLRITATELMAARTSRETTKALYLAEYGADVMRLLAPSSPLTAKPCYYSDGSQENGLSTSPATLPIRVPPQPPEALPGADPTTVGSIGYLACIHNNSGDPNYWAVPSKGNVDSDGIYTIESWGYGPGGSFARITVDIKPSPASGGGVGTDYAQGGGQFGGGALGQAGGDLSVLGLVNEGTYGQL